MSTELTTPIKIEIPGIGTIESADLYIKSEADKVIEELKSEIERLEILCDNYRHDCDNLAISNEQASRSARTLLKKMNYNKYKRCLAMAERCKDKIENVVQYNEHDNWLIINEYWERWQERWLNIAEQFKEDSK